MGAWCGTTGAMKPALTNAAAPRMADRGAAAQPRACPARTGPDAPRRAPAGLDPARAGSARPSLEHPLSVPLVSLLHMPQLRGFEPPFSGCAETSDGQAEGHG
ncbi:hypothetical protein GCM10019017_23900 [Streptomyces showdoensis]